MQVPAQYRAVIAQNLRRGLASFKVPEPMTLRQHAELHFYLSAESSYVEKRWEAWPFQRAILACVGNDDIQEVDVQKSARVGYTKILLAAIAYFAEHRRRNQVLWQPTDSARDEFVKTELEPMLRDVRVMHPIFPTRLARHKDNTLLVKKFIGSMLHLRGGRSADNYRRLSPSVGYLDEFSSFDSNIDGEGDPGDLAAKRLEGATFPKLVVGSTPKIAGVCLMEKRANGAVARYDYHINCPHCAGHHALTWGGKDEPHGFKWVDRDPDSVRHLCPHCGAQITQAEYLDAAESGFWYGDDGTTIDHDGVFRNAVGEVIPPHRRIAFRVWTGYTPISDDVKALTLHYYLDGLFHKIMDARGTVSFDITAKGIPFMRYRFMGAYSPIADGANPSNVDYAAFMKPLGVNKANTPTWALGAYTGCLQQLTFDVANQLVWRSLVSCEGAEITERQPTGNILLELPRIAQLNWPQMVLDAQEQAVSITHGKVAGNIIDVRLPKAQLTNPAYSDQDGTAMLGLNLNVNPDQGNDEIEIVVR
ncbi:phage terminase large subunit family protein [Pigmentiphaga sp. CHJ604]|uniref:phage tail tube protein n=1 Tax=Pigmentiphaga sp. CHJ604 TaxID=3081984 RepID=UPI0030CBA30D